MPISRVDLLATIPEEIWQWDDSLLDEALNELQIEIGTSWLKTKKADEINKAIKEHNGKNKEHLDATTEQDCLMDQVFISEL